MPLPGCRRADQCPTPAAGPGSCGAKNGAQQMAAGAGSCTPTPPHSDHSRAVIAASPPLPPPCLSFPVAVTPQHKHWGSGAGEGGGEGGEDGRGRDNPPLSQFPHELHRPTHCAVMGGGRWERPPPRASVSPPKPGLRAAELREWGGGGSSEGRSGDTRPPGGGRATRMGIGGRGFDSPPGKSWKVSVTVSV